MKRIRNISLVFEGDESALKRTASLAKDCTARLHIVFPIKLGAARPGRLRIGTKRVDLQKLLLQEGRERLGDAARSARTSGARVATRLRVGEPFVEIIRDVMEHDIDLVVLATTAKAGLKRRLFGGVSTHLMRKCPAPVLILRPGRSERFRRIVAAVDPEVKGDAHDTLNGRILELAKTLATRDRAKLHVVHAWSVLAESILRGRAGVSPDEVRSLVRSEAARHRDEVRRLLARHSVTGHRLHLIKGDPANVIPEVVARLRADLLVMGTVCRTGIPGLFIGNTAERILNAVDCSVLTVKPRGFVSPVLAEIPQVS
jgi:universal stress protein E